MSKMPKEIKGLWELQYASLEKQIKEVVGTDNEQYKIYEKMNWMKKISVLDRFASSLGLS